MKCGAKSEDDDTRDGNKSRDQWAEDLARIPLPLDVGLAHIGTRTAFCALQSTRTAFLHIEILARQMMDR
jgi:hypothetical protein